jgi:negative regulator of sigma E activity
MRRWLGAALIGATLVSPACFASEAIVSAARYRPAAVNQMPKPDPQPSGQGQPALAGNPDEAPAVAQRVPAPPDAHQLLVRAHQAEGRVAFSGRQATAVPHATRTTTTIVQEYHTGDGRLRVETVTPQSAHGRVVVDDGRYRWQYEPSTGILERHPSAPPVHSPSVDELLVQYAGVVQAHPSRVAGRQAWRLDLTPRVAGKASQRLWVDALTGLVLRSEKRRPDGRMMSASYFTDLQVGNQPAHLFQQPGPAGVRVVGAKPRAAPLTLAEARAWFGLPLTARLPAGYTFADASLLQRKGPAVAHLRYQDGLNAVSLYVAPRGSLPYDLSQGKSVKLNGGTGRLRTRRSYYVLSWRGQKADFALVGDIPPELLVTLANGTALTAGAGPTAAPQIGSLSRWLLGLSVLFLGLSGLLHVLRRSVRWPGSDERRPAASLSGEFRR